MGVEIIYPETKVLTGGILRPVLKTLGMDFETSLRPVLKTLGADLETKLRPVLKAQLAAGWPTILKGVEIAKAIHAAELKRDGFIANVMTVWSGDYDDEDVMSALQTLASVYLTRGKVFHPARWRGLEQSYRNEYGQQRWAESARTALFLAIKQRGFGELSLGAIYPAVRRELRKEFERSLLGGRTLDQKTEVAGVVTLESLAGNMPVQSIDAWLDLQARLSVLSGKERNVLAAGYEGFRDDEIAEWFGVKPATIRQWRARARCKLKR